MSKSCVYCGVDLTDSQYGLDYRENMGGGFFGGPHPTMWHECSACQKTFNDMEKLIRSSRYAKTMAALIVAHEGGES